MQTYKCECGYTQDFNPTKKNMEKYFPHILDKKKCPSCKNNALDKIKAEKLIKKNK